MPDVPNLHSEYVSGLALLARQTRERIASLITHDGEKGRVLEGIAKSLLSRFLPRKYSIGTGLIVASDGRVSRQTDIVIYDNEQNAPLLLEHGLGLFPVECVYATIEVKSRIDGPSLDGSAQAIGQVRALRTTKAYSAYDTVGAGEGPTMRVRYSLQSTLAPRAYIFAFETSYASLNSLCDAALRVLDPNGAHLHGMLVLDKEWFVFQEPFTASPSLKRAEQDGVQHFCLSLLANLESFEMKPADLSRYFANLSEMRKHFIPQSEQPAGSVE